MAIRKYYFGSVGPFYYDDAELVNDPDGDFAGMTRKAFLASGPIQVEVSSTAPTTLPEYTVATAPDPTLYEGYMIYVSNGAGGLPIVAFSNGTNWLRCDTRAAISS